MIRILFTVPSLHPDYGGEAASVLGLGAAVAKEGAGVHVVTLEPPLEPVAGMAVTPVPHLRAPGLRASWAPRFRRKLVEICRGEGISLVHDNGLWQPMHHDVAAAARTLDLPLVVSPHGALESGALSRKTVRKRVALALYQRRDLRAASCLHATSSAEAEAMRRLGFAQPIALVANGVHVPPRPLRTGPGRTALFLSRLSPAKGLPDLVGAWTRIEAPGWTVVIAGPDEEGHRGAVEAEIRERGLQGVFRFAGAVHGESKWDLYRSADLFVLPTHGESFGIVVAEALACGLPVITTKAAPWSALVSERCGWWIEDTADALASALREALALPDAARIEMGERGRAYAERHLRWDRAGADMRAVYDWLLGAGPRPPCVR